MVAGLDVRAEARTYLRSKNHSDDDASASFLEMFSD